MKDPLSQPGKIPNHSTSKSIESNENNSPDVYGSNIYNDKSTDKDFNFRSENKSNANGSFLPPIKIGK